MTRTPLPLFRRLTVGAAIEKNFLFFSDFRFVSPILGFRLNSFSEYIRFDSL